MTHTVFFYLQARGDTVMRLPYALATFQRTHGRVICASAMSFALLMILIFRRFKPRNIIIVKY